MPIINQTLFIAAILLLLSVISSKASARFGIPSLLIFLAVGMLAGVEGPGRINFDSHETVQWIGTIALIMILFEGGLQTEWRAIRGVLVPGILLSTFGVMLTAGLIAAFTMLISNIPWQAALLLGCILSSTDAPAVFSILRASRLRLAPRITALLEFESGSNDPLAAALTISLISMIQHKSTLPVGSVVLSIMGEMIIGLAVGYVLARLGLWLINNIQLSFAGLYPPLTTGLALAIYASATLLGGSGFLAIYIAGITLNHHAFIHKRSLKQFHQGLAFLLQITIFLFLGLLVYPSQLKPVAIFACSIACFLMFIARPLTVMLLSCFSGFKFKERLFLSWVGLRGAVPIILGTYPLSAQIPYAELFFNVIFFVVILSVAMQGMTAAPLARLCKITTDDDTPSHQQQQQFLANASLNDNLLRISIPANHSIINTQIVELGLPQGVLVAAIERSQGLMIPSGSTHVLAHDTLLLLGDLPSLDKAKILLGMQHRSPAT